MTYSRQELLGMNPIFTDHLIRIQRLKYLPNDPWKAGEEVYLYGDEDVTVLSEEQAEEMNREDREYFLANCDRVPPHKERTTVATSFLAAPGDDAEQYLEKLGAALGELSNQLGPLIVLGDWNTPWLSQKNDYPPVAEALQFLARQIEETFNGGFVLEGEKVAPFITHLFWLVRCNANLPEFMMTFAKANYVMSICKYGLLHLAFYEEAEADIILSLLQEKGFGLMDNCQDPVQFDDFGGRRFELDDPEEA